jgi:DNA-binding response OmpR family regulator
VCAGSAVISAMGTRPLLALGVFERGEREQLSRVSAESGHDLVVAQDTESAASYLESYQPHVVLVDTRLAEGEAFCLNLRARLTHAMTPIVALAQDVSDLAFAGAFSWGGDDVVTLQNQRALIGRLRRLPAEVCLPPSTRRGVAVVADPDRDRRLVRARVLRNAGYQVQFAAGAQELERAREASPALVVVDEELLGGEPWQVANDGHQVNTLVLAAPRRLGGLLARFGHLSSTLVADGFAPPENIVFLANELSRGGASDKRSSKRLLYGTRVTFRGEGREEEDRGYSYNISQGGLYVRSLAQPDDDRVWIELRPPRSDRLVRLEGEVVWRRPFGPHGFATVPPGFGIRIADATASNRHAWEAGYSTFAAALGVAA